MSKPQRMSTRLGMKRIHARRRSRLRVSSRAISVTVFAGLTSLLGTRCSQVERPALAHWTLVPEMRIGESLEVSGITKIRITPDGLVLLATAQPVSILLLEQSTGTLIRSMGRQGRGPGEFTMLGMIGSVGDSIWGVDLMSSQVSLFDRSGRVAHAWRVEPPGFAAFNQPAALFSDGTAVLPVFRRESPLVSRHVVFRTRWDGSILDTLVHIPTRTTELPLDGANGLVQTSQPFGDDPLYGISPDGRFIAVVDVAVEEVGPDSVRITLQQSDQRPVYRRTIPWAHEPLTPGLIDSTVRAKATQLRLRRIPASAIRARLYTPSHASPVSALLVGTDGSVWLKAARKSDQFDWLVVDRRGALVASVTMPSNSRVLTLDRGVWGIETDANGLPIVVRWRTAPTEPHARP